MKNVPRKNNLLEGKIFIFLKFYFIMYTYDYRCLLR